MGIAQRIAPRILTQAKGDIFLVQGGIDASGRKSWYFVRVQSSKVRAFLAAVAQKHINISQYGEIVVSGFGETPPTHVVEHMRIAHGYTGQPA